MVIISFLLPHFVQCWFSFFSPFSQLLWMGNELGVSVGGVGVGGVGVGGEGVGGEGVARAGDGPVPTKTGSNNKEGRVYCC